MDKESSDRIASGVEGFDSICGGGFERNSMNLVRGGPGMGKTMFALQFLHIGHSRYKEAGLYISFSESKQSVYKTAASICRDLDAWEEQGKFLFVNHSPHEVERILKEGGGTLKDEIDQLGAKRVVIDSLTAYSLYFQTPYQKNEGIVRLFDILNRWNVTTLVLDERDVVPSTLERGREGFLSDSITHLYDIRIGSSRRRVLEIKKMRHVAHSMNLVPFNIGKNGIVLSPKERIQLD